MQLSASVQVFLASFLVAGALATLRYSQILYQLPISLFGMAVPDPRPGGRWSPPCTRCSAAGSRSG